MGFEYPSRRSEMVRHDDITEGTQGKDGKILQSPVREIENYHRNGVRYEKQEVQGTCRFDGIKGRVLDMTVEIAGGDFREFTISVAQNEQFHTDFSILQHKNRIEIDRTYSGMVRDANAIRRIKVKSPCKNGSFV